jgi:hypothetical protein
MLAVALASAWRRGRVTGLALLGVVIVLAGGGSAVASAAPTGQIVWSAGNSIWAMYDDGSDPHQLISPASTPLRSLLPSGTLAEPDVFQNGGTTVLFLGLTNAFADPQLPLACGADCAGTFELHDGVLTALGPRAAAAPGAAYYESQPRLTADGQELFGSTLYTGIVTSSLGMPATALVERALAQNATVTQWSSTDSEVEPQAGFDGTPDPADPTMAAWVEAQGCGYHVTNAEGAQQASCQYAVHFGALSDLSPAVVIYDNEYVSSNGRGPTSIALSTDGTMLLLVDPSAPNTGIYETPVAGVPGQKPVTEVLPQPAGWTFGQARFAGANIVFDAHQQIDGRQTGDIYTIPADCGAPVACSFPASARDLSNDPTADSSDPAWTSATTPIAPLHIAASPRITALSAPLAPVRAGHAVTLVVKLSAPATIVVKLARRVGGGSRSAGSLASAGQAGANRIVIRKLAGRALLAGSYTATVTLSGSSAPATTVHFSIGAGT